MYMLVDPSSRILDFRGPKGEEPERTAGIVSAHWRLIAPAPLAISFLHCRNFTTDTVVPDQKLNRARARRSARNFRRSIHLPARVA